jgi:hypothetical protein
MTFLDGWYSRLGFFFAGPPSSDSRSLGGRVEAVSGGGETNINPLLLVSFLDAASLFEVVALVTA